MKQQRTSSRSRRRAILEAALACFAEAGVASVSIGEICARSGASVGSVYHHFGSKDGIVVALIADGLASHLEALQQRLDTARGDARGSIEAQVCGLIAWIEAHPGWAAFIYANLNNSHVSSAEPIRRVNQRYADLVEEYFGALIGAGKIRALPRDCWSSLIAAPIHDYARRWLRGQVERPPSAHQSLFVESAWRVVKPD